MFKKKFAKILLPIFLFLISFNFVFATDLKDYIDPLGVAKEGATNITDALGGAATKVLNQVFGIIGIVALVMFIYSGVMYIASLGNAEKAKKAITHIKWAVVGLVIVFLSYAIVLFVLTQIKGLNVS